MVTFTCAKVFGEIKQYTVGVILIHGGNVRGLSKCACSWGRYFVVYGLLHYSADNALLCYLFVGTLIR